MIGIKYLSTINIYLDIDGVILANDKQPALHAEEFIRHLVEHYPVFWLTTHCRNPGDDPVPTLARFFDAATVERLTSVQPAYWDVLKTEAIDFSQPFLWFDDDPLATEREILAQHGVLDSWVEIDLAKDLHQLHAIIMQLA